MAVPQNDLTDSTQYRVLINGVRDEDFYVRVFSMSFDNQWGPPRVSDPLITTPRYAIVTAVEGGQNLPLHGGLVLISVVNLGSGLYAHLVPVIATMVNGTGGKSYNVRPGTGGVSAILLNVDRVKREKGRGGDGFAKVGERLPRTVLLRRALR